MTIGSRKRSPKIGLRVGQPSAPPNLVTISHALPSLRTGQDAFAHAPLSPPLTPPPFFPLHTRPAPSTRYCWTCRPKSLDLKIVDCPDITNNVVLRNNAWTLSPHTPSSPSDGGPSSMLVPCQFTLIQALLTPISATIVESRGGEP